MATTMQLLGEFEIKKKMPGMNDIIAASKKHWAVYAKMKEKYTKLVMDAAKKAKVKLVINQVTVVCDWHEPKTGLRDPDNVFAGKKFIFDGLVNAGIIFDDNKTWVAGARDNIDYDLPSKEHGVIVSVYDVVIYWHGGTGL